MISKRILAVRPWQERMRQDFRVPVHQQHHPRMGMAAALDRSGAVNDVNPPPAPEGVDHSGTADIVSLTEAILKRSNEEARQGNLNSMAWNKMRFDRHLTWVKSQFKEGDWVTLVYKDSLTGKDIGPNPESKHAPVSYEITGWEELHHLAQMDTGTGFPKVTYMRGITFSGGRAFAMSMGRFRKLTDWEYDLVVSETKPVQHTAD